MENILSNPNFLQEMTNTGFEELTKYCNIFIGMFCFIQIIKISLQIVDYFLGTENNQKVVTVQFMHQPVENQDEPEENTDEGDCESDEEIQSVRAYSTQLQHKISKVIALNNDLFTDRRAQTRMKYHINKQITEYFKTVEYLIEIEKNEKNQTNDHESENESENEDLKVKATSS